MIDHIYDRRAAAKMGLEWEGQVCVMIHSGSRGLGHQVATDALVQMPHVQGATGSSLPLAAASYIAKCQGAQAK